MTAGSSARRDWPAGGRPLVAGGGDRVESHRDSTAESDARAASDRAGWTEGRGIAPERGLRMLGLRELAMVATVVLVLYGRSGVLQQPAVPVHLAVDRAGAAQAGPARGRSRGDAGGPGPSSAPPAPPPASPASPGCSSSRGTACSGS